MIKLGLLKVGDVVQANNSSHFNLYGTSLLSPEQNFFLMSLIDSFPAESGAPLLNLSLMCRQLKKFQTTPKLDWETETQF